MVNARRGATWREKLIKLKTIKKICKIKFDQNYNNFSLWQRVFWSSWIEVFYRPLKIELTFTKVEQKSVQKEDTLSLANNEKLWLFSLFEQKGQQGKQMLSFFCCSCWLTNVNMKENHVSFQFLKMIPSSRGGLELEVELWTDNSLPSASVDQSRLE